MTPPESAAPPTIALIGNPNTGKSTLFSALAGVRQRVGNYPGVTVEKKLGRMTHDGRTYVLVDLPGTYSLAPRSPDEMVAVDLLLGRMDEGAPDAVLCIVDASNLERNLYLVSQVLELGLPTVVALNMTDVAQARGITIDMAELSKRIGAPIRAIQAHHGVGFDDLRRALAEACSASVVSPPADVFPPRFDQEVDGFAAVFARTTSSEPPPRYLMRRLLLDTSGYLQSRLLAVGEGQNGPDTEGSSTGTIATALAESRERLKAAGLPVPAVEAMSRYAWVGKVVEGAVTRSEVRTKSLTDRIDRVLTHRVGGVLIFAAMMFVVFLAVFSWAAPLMDLIEAGVGLAGEWTASVVPQGALQSLLVSGVIGGVGGVVIFLPQILILFLFIGVLEDCGYMARAAYLMDKLMVRVGLSGKSFIPLLSSFACAIPGIMATRVIENRRDRLTTILIAPLMSCSARLPVYVLLISAFVPSDTSLGRGLHALVMFSMYLVGILAAVVVALLLKKTLLRGPTPPFVLELPSYKMPSLRTIFFRVIDRGWAFLKNAGTLIFAVSIIVWALLYFPRDEEAVEGPYRERMAQLKQTIELPGGATDEETAETQKIAEEKLAEIEQHIEGEYKRHSYLGRMGRAIEPIVEPLGWDWRIGSAAIASFPAREVVVATMGILFDAGEEEADEDRPRLQRALHEATFHGTDRPLFNLATALSLMVFFALCAQCAATLAVIRRETNSWGWPLFTFVYMTGLAYVAAWATFQITSRFI